MLMIGSKCVSAYFYRNRMFVWRIMTSILTFILIYIIPISYVIELVMQKSKKKVKLLCYLTVFFLIISSMLYLFSAVLHELLLSSGTGASLLDFLTSQDTQIEFIILIGAVLSSFLQGFTAINQFFEALSDPPLSSSSFKDLLPPIRSDLSKTHTDIIYKQTQKRISYVLQQISKNKREL